MIAAPNPEMEALAIAVAMREARHLGKSAALVTPDRALARRVMAALSRWNLGYDDSGGDALMETSAGIFARLAAEAVAKGLEPPTLLALLEASAVPARPCARRVHGRARNARTRGAARHPAAARKRRARAATSPASATNSPSSAAARPPSLHPSEPRARLAADALDRAEALVAGLRAALAPLESLSSSKPYDFAELAARHREVLIELSRDEAGVALAFEASEGTALAAAFDDLLGERQRCGLMVALPDYPDLFQTAFGDRAVRRPGTARRDAAHLRSAGIAADAGRSRHHRRIDRGRLAAGAAHRSLAEPADAP